MLKSGLIVGVVAVILAIGSTLLAPICTPCLALFMGVVAGYLAGLFDKPATNGASAKAGALAGLIGGIGALVGQAIGTIINGFIVGPEAAARITQSLDLPSSGAATASGYWVGLIGGGLCFGLLDVVFMAALGALGGVLWWQLSGKKNSLPAAPAE